MAVQVFAQTMACNVTSASAPVTFAAGARNVTVYIPAAASGADVRFLTSYDGGTTYTNIKYAPTSGVTVIGNVQIGSAVTNTCVRINELAGLLYVKAEYTTAVVSTSGVFYYIVDSGV